MEKTSPVKQITRICVYSGSSDRLSQTYLDAAYNLGQVIARHGMALVFGGGKTGLMGASADGALAAGGEVIGVITAQLNTPQLAHPGLTRMEIAGDMHQRKARMSELADAFIALPGGYGTYEELFETITWAQLQIHQKPVGILNTGGFYQPLLALIDQAIREGFIYPDHRQLFCSDTDAETLIAQMLAYTPPTTLAHWVKRED